MLAVYWRQLYMGNNSTIKYTNTEEETIISWGSFYHTKASATSLSYPKSFQVIIKKDGTFYFRHEYNMNGAGQNAVVGISRGPYFVKNYSPNEETGVDRGFYCALFTQ